MTEAALLRRQPHRPPRAAAHGGRDRPGQVPGGGVGWRELEPSFFTVVVWREQAEHAARSLAKGSRAMVIGRLQQRTWTAGTGAPGRSRSWPRRWAPACGGRPPRRPGRPGRAEPGGLPGHHRRPPPHQEPVINVTSRRCPRSPTDRFTAPGVSATIHHRAIHHHPARAPGGYSDGSRQPCHPHCCAGRRPLCSYAWPVLAVQR
jgi:hypothetical protein